MDNQIQVWDKFVRVFHWSLVPLFCVAYVTGDDNNSLHQSLGYALLCLVLATLLASGKLRLHLYRYFFAA